MTELEDPSKAPENPSEPLEDPKTLAKRLLAEGSTVDEVVAETNLSRPTVLGFLGAARKAEKKLEKAQGEPSGLGKADDEEKNLIEDFKGENALAASAVILARNKSRLKLQDPALYNSLFPSGQQPESNTSRLADLEIARYIRSMRLEEESARHNNGDSSNETALLRKELQNVKEEMRKKDVEDLKGQIAELRQEMRHSTNSASDLAVVVREGKDLLVKALENPGPLRNYLAPDNVNIRSPGDAPALLRAQPAEAQSGLIAALRAHGLTTHVVQR